MRSIKPGRGPSMMGGVMSLLVGLFGVIWTVVAANMGGGVFALFGVVFIVVAIVQAVYHFRNATSKNRYSAFDITNDNEEVDPLNQRFGAQPEPEDGHNISSGESSFCPYCGTPVSTDYAYCRKCGKQLPR